MERVGKYQVVRLLGEGGMGRVFEAVDPVIGRRVAIKTIAFHVADDDDVRGRFLREAQAAGRLSHPNLITIHDVGEEDGRQFLVMEFLDGQDLRGAIAANLMTLDTKVRVMIEVCQGLAHAHAHGVIHRDIKPANIFVGPQGHIKILDFGLARGQVSEYTQTGKVIGTPNYMAPEQIRGEAVDHRADIFAAGVVFYELLSGKKAFDAETITATIYKILEHHPMPVHEIDPVMPLRLSQIVTRALEKERDRRYETVGEMLAELLEVRQSLGPVSSGGRSSAATIFDLPPSASGISRSAPLSRVPASPPSTRGESLPSSGGTSLPSSGAASRPSSGAASQPSSGAASQPSSGAASQPSSGAASLPSIPAGTPAPGQPAAVAAHSGRTFDWRWIAAAAGLVVVGGGFFLYTRPVAREPLATAALESPRPPADAPAPVAPPVASPDPITPPATAAPAATTKPSPPAPIAPVTAPAPATRAGVPPARGASEPSRSAATKAADTVRPPPETQRPAVESAEPGRASGAPEPAPNPPRVAEPPAATDVPRAAPVVPEPAASAPPAPAAVSAVPPPAAPSAPAATDTSAVQATLAKYKSALESRDLGALKQIWPALGGRQEAALKTEFENAKSIVADFDNMNVRVTNASATLTCRRNYVVVTGQGQTLRTATKMTMTLDRRGSGWVIDSIRHEAER